MTEEARKCISALQVHISMGYPLIGGFDGSVKASEMVALIESLSAENDMLNAAHGQLGAIECERDMLKHELDQVTRERDAAVEDLILGRICATCRHHNNSATSKCMGCLSWHSNWQWRGVEKEVGG